jgi:hypothetical protein
VSFLSRDIIAPEHTKYVYTTAGAIVGGVMFGMTGSWAMAITWDIIAVVATWLGVRLAETAGGWILNLVSLFVTWK